MGHPQFQSMTVMGEPVVIANDLCAGAPRDHNVILIDGATLAGIDRDIATKPVPQALLKKTQRR